MSIATTTTAPNNTAAYGTFAPRSAKPPARSAEMPRGGQTVIGHIQVYEEQCESDKAQTAPIAGDIAIIGKVSSG
jgi:hypothetical protein